MDAEIVIIRRWQMILVSTEILYIPVPQGRYHHLVFYPDLIIYLYGGVEAQVQQGLWLVYARILPFLVQIEDHVLCVMALKQFSSSLTTDAGIHL